MRRNCRHKSAEPLPELSGELKNVNTITDFLYYLIKTSVKDFVI